MGREHSWLNSFPAVAIPIIPKEDFFAFWKAIVYRNCTAGNSGIIDCYKLLLNFFLAESKVIKFKMENHLTLMQLLTHSTSWKIWLSCTECYALED